MVDRRFYNCVLSQAFSPCGNYLVCGSVYGDIAVFDLKLILDTDDKNPEKGPKCTFSTPNQKQVCSMASTEQFLITGTVGAIFGWDWNSVRSFTPEVSWTIHLPSSKEKMLEVDVNSLFIRDTDSPSLFAGCGDNQIYSFSLEDGKIQRTFSGHTDFLHSICHNDWQMASASEDGSVRLWDLRQAAVTSIIEPSKEPKLARTHFGKWIGDVSITSDWLVCGGGPRLGLWHMRTLEMMTTFPEMSDFKIHIAQLQGDSVLCGGADSLFYQASYTGQIRSRMSTSSSTLYSALFRDAPQNVLSLVGSSGNIDICTNFTYRHKVLNFYPQ